LFDETDNLSANAVTL